MQPAFVNDTEQSSQMMEEMKTQLHNLRITNMELRTDKAQLKRKNDTIEQDNKSLRDRVETLNQKSIEDCDFIIEQMKSLQKSELTNTKANKKATKKAKASVKKLGAQNIANKELYEKSLKQAKREFLKLLDVKLQYEHIISDLIKNPVLTEPVL